jgi:hypothetical protein
MPQSIKELLEESRRLCKQSRALREAVKETTLAASSAVDRAKALIHSIKQDKRKPK